MVTTEHLDKVYGSFLYCFWNSSVNLKLFQNEMIILKDREKEENWQVHNDNDQGEEILFFPEQCQLRRI